MRSMEFDSIFVRASLFLLCFLVAPANHAATVWSGPQISFAKPNGANPNLAANQDRLTANVWLTRGSSQGLYNASTEGFFTQFVSPSGTEWATGSLANYNSLSYTDWNHWAKGVNAGPPSTVGVNTVLHLIPDDIYLSIRFTSWTSGGAGGGFSYDRSTPVIPEPAPALFGLLGGAALTGFYRFRTQKQLGVPGAARQSAWALGCF